MADELKQLTNKAYTCTDLNCPQYYHMKNRQKWERIFKKRAKRRMKRNLEKDVYETESFAD